MAFANSMNAQLKSLIGKRQDVQVKIAAIRKQKDMEFQSATADLQNELATTYADEARIVRVLSLKSKPIEPAPHLTSVTNDPD